MNKIRFVNSASRDLARIALLFFLVILLLQSAIGLFVPAVEGLESIDIVLRTTLSSIFGYLMTSVWKTAENSPPKKASAPRTIGFANDTPSPTASQPHEPSTSTKIPQPPNQTTHPHPPIQIYALTATGLFCLLTLIALRFFGGYLSIESGEIATIAQYRDIISGSVGALIGLVRSKDTPLRE